MDIKNQTSPAYSRSTALQWRIYGGATKSASPSYIGQTSVLLHIPPNKRRWWIRPILWGAWQLVTLVTVTLPYCHVTKIKRQGICRGWGTWVCVPIKTGLVSLIAMASKIITRVTLIWDTVKSGHLYSALPYLTKANPKVHVASLNLKLHSRKLISSRLANFLQKLL